MLSISRHLWPPMSLIQDKRDAMICKAFAITLCDGVQKWFKNLEPCTITSFSQFIKFFITNYTSTKQMRKKYHHLFLITQRNGKLIEEYIRRFEEEKLEIIDYPNSITIKAFKHGLLRNFNLFAELTKIILQMIG